jgi:hypothetical protein
MTKELEQKMNELAAEHNKALRYFENASFDTVYRNGFKACYNLMQAERERSKILVEAIEKYTEYSYSSILDEALAKYKEQK